MTRNFFFEFMFFVLFTILRCCSLVKFLACIKLFLADARFILTCISWLLWQEVVTLYFQMRSQNSRQQKERNLVKPALSLNKGLPKAKITITTQQWGAQGLCNWDWSFPIDSGILRCVCKTDDQLWRWTYHWRSQQKGRDSKELHKDKSLEHVVQP